VNPTDPNFDWVDVRAGCTPSRVFEAIRLQVQRDVKKRNDIRTENERGKHGFIYMPSGNQFSVLVEGNFVESGVTFTRTPMGIDVHKLDDNSLILRGIVTLSNDGECKLRNGDEELTFWQFRKVALEDVFFTAVAKWLP
jgi:hypothetical protein